MKNHLQTGFVARVVATKVASEDPVGDHFAALGFCRPDGLIGEAQTQHRFTGQGPDHLAHHALFHGHGVLSGAVHLEVAPQALEGLAARVVEALHPHQPPESAFAWRLIAFLLGLDSGWRKEGMNGAINGHPLS